MSTFEQRRNQVLTPALEGSKIVEPANSLAPFRGRPVTQGGNMNGPFYRGSPGYGGYALPPIGGGPRPFMNVMPGERMSFPGMMPSDRMSVPTLMPRSRYPYAGPRSLMPYWGGYSVAGQYHPEPRVIPVPVRIPRYQPPPPQPIITHQPPPRLPYYPFPTFYRRPIPLPVLIRKVPKIPKKPVKKKAHTGPRSEARDKFRHVALAAFFIAHLKENVKKNVQSRPSSMFLFGIILKEIVAALHRIYLNPNGNIYPVLTDIIGPNCYDMAMLVHGGCKDPREESVLIQELQYVVENVIYHITEIMPGTGVLGTHRKSAVFELIRNGKRFPEGYFWQVEKDRMEFTENGRTVNIGSMEAFLLMVGIFVSRSLVTTILLKPVDYGLSSEPLSEIAERNLRVVASTILYMVRNIASTREQGIMGMPSEIAKYLYSDQEMKHIYNKLGRTFNYCEGLLREWGTEYCRRLNASANVND